MELMELYDQIYNPIDDLSEKKKKWKKVKK